MALELVRLKLAIQRRALGGAGLGSKVGFVAGWLVALVLGIATGHVVGVRALEAPGGGELLVLVVFTGLFLGWVLGPIMMPGLGDQTVDPARLEMFPITPRQQVRGLLLGGLVAPTSLFTLLVAAGGTFAAGRSLGVRLVVLVGGLVFVVLCVASSRAAQALMAGVLNSRRGRDMVIFTAALLGLGVALITKYLQQLVAAVADAQDSGLQVVLGWLPPGGVGQARFAADAGDWGQVALHIAIAALLAVGAMALWEWAIKRRVEGKYSGGQSAKRSAAAAAAATLALLPFPVSAARPSALTAATSQQLRYYFFRSPQALQSAVLTIVMALVVGHTTASQGDSVGMLIGAIGFAFIITSLVSGNLFGYDDRGFSGLLVTGAPWRTVLVGKALAWPIVSSTTLIAFILVESTLNGHWAGVGTALMAGLAVIVAGTSLDARISVRRPQNRIRRNGGALAPIMTFVAFFLGMICYGVVAGLLFLWLRKGLPDPVLALGGLALVTLAAIPLIGSAATKLERDPWRVEAILMGDPIPSPPPVVATGDGPQSKLTPIVNYLDWSDRGNAAIGAYVRGLLLIVVLWQVIGSFPIVFLHMGAGWSPSDGTIHALLLMGAGVVLAFLGTPLIVAWINKRPWFSVAMPKLQIRWREFGLGILTTVVGLTVGAALASPWWPVTFKGFDWGRLVPAAVVGAVTILLAAGFEELLFRGYLMQFIRRIINAPALIIGTPAVIFALLHIGNLKAYGGNALVLVPYLGMGLAFGWAAWRSGSLWLPLGMHWANNLSAIVLLGLYGDVLPTVAPFTRDIADAPAWLLAASSVVSLGVNVAIVGWVLRRRESRAAAQPTANETEAARVG